MLKSAVYALLAAGAVLAIGVVPAAADTYLVNGSFETGDFTGWTGPGDSDLAGIDQVGLTSVVSGSTYANSYAGGQDGASYVIGGQIDSDFTLSQTFTDVSGERLEISGWIAAVGDQGSDIKVLFNNAVIFSVTNPDPGGDWVLRTFRVTATGYDKITLAFHDNPGFLALDNFSAALSAAPVPAALPLFAAGLGAFGVVGWMRKRKRS